MVLQGRFDNSLTNRLIFEAQEQLLVDRDMWRGLSMISFACRVRIVL